MTDAVKMAIEALTDIRTSIECAAGCDEGVDPMAAVSEILSAYGTAMASAYSRAADMLNILAALEQAGEPVADALGDIQRFHKSYICLGGDDDGEEYVRWSDVLAALPTLQRLGQEFDAGEVKLHYSGDVMEAVQQLLERGRATLDTEGYLVAHPPQSRGQAFDGEGEAAALRIGWWNDMRRRGVSQENAILAINAALSSAKRGDEG